MTSWEDDILLARTWAAQLDEWVRRHGLQGYDPFDIKAHAFFRAAQARAIPRRMASAALDLFPVTMRRLLGIKPSDNAKAYALVAMARLRLHEMSGNDRPLAEAAQCLEWLREHAHIDDAGMSWGYPFDVSGKGMYRPAGTPVGVVTATAGQAFALAWRLTGDDGYRECVCDVARFISRGLNRIDGGDGTFCFSYTSIDEWPVHNANLLAVAHLYRATSVTGDARWQADATAALNYTLRRQRPDGSWPYGEYDPAAGYEKAVLETVDHHHTGFVLRCLYEINELAPADRLRDAMVRGYDFYNRRLFDAAGIPRITTAALWPVNIHACAEAILCPATLDALVPGAMKRAVNVINWTRKRMADRHTGLPYYRRYPFLANKLLSPRWGVAWMLYALCEFLYRCTPKPLAPSPTS